MEPKDNGYWDDDHGYVRGFGWVTETYDGDGRCVGIKQTPAPRQDPHLYGWGKCRNCDIEVWASHDEGNVCYCDESIEDMLHTHCPRCGAWIPLCMTCTSTMGERGEVE